MQLGMPIPAAAVSAELERVLARAELNPRESLLEKLIEWLAPKLSTHEADLLGKTLLGLLIGAAVVALTLLVRRAWLAFRAGELEEDEDEEPRRDPRARLAELLAAAHAARASGDLRLALRCSFHALLVALGGRGDLELRPAWTNRELLARGRPTRAVQELLEPLVRELEPKEFGRASVGPEDLARLEALLAPHVAGLGERG